MIELTEESLKELLNEIKSDVDADREISVRLIDNLENLIVEIKSRVQINDETFKLFKEMSSCSVNLMKIASSSTEKMIKISKIMADYIGGMDNSGNLSDEEREDLAETIKRTREESLLNNVLELQTR